MTHDIHTAATSFFETCMEKPVSAFTSKMIEVVTVKELEDATRELHQIQSALRASGRIASLTSGRGKYVALTYDRLTLRVSVTKVAKHTNTTETSRQAYHTSDFSTQEAQVAGCIFDHSMGDVTRAEIAKKLGIQEGRVSARVNALLKAYGQGGYTAPSGNYRLAITGKRLSKCHGASDKENECMRFEKCEPVPQSGAQIELLTFK